MYKKDEEDRIEILDEESHEENSLYESDGDNETDGEQLENLQNYMDNIKLNIQKDNDDTKKETENDVEFTVERNQEDKNITVKAGKKRKGPPSTFGELASSYDTGHVITDDDNIEWIVTESKNKIKRWKKKI